MVKAADEPVFAIDDRVAVEHLVDLTVTYDEALHAPASPCWCRGGGTSSSPR